MNRTDDSRKALSTQRQKDKPVHAVPPSSRSFYLIIYNLVSALLWSVVLGRTLYIAGIYGYDQLYTGIGAFTKWTQTLAGLEVLHALIGASRSNRRGQREKLIQVQVWSGRRFSPPSCKSPPDTSSFGASSTTSPIPPPTLLPILQCLLPGAQQRSFATHTSCSTSHMAKSLVG